MSGMQNITKITLAWELNQAGITNEKIASQICVHRETVGLWIKGIGSLGLVPFLDAYTSAKKGPRTKRQIDPLIKLWVWEIRERERDCCGQKILYFLKREKGISLSISKVYEILAEKYQLRTKWKKNQTRGVIPIADHKRQVIQMDSVDFGEVYAFTAVDIFTREVDVMLRNKLEAVDGQAFLHFCMKRRFNSFTETIQTDGGSEFKAEFHHDVPLFANRHRYARPYRKNEQSYIESFNRSLRKECLGWTKYRQSQLSILTKEVEDYLKWYHYHRPHLGLGLITPLKD